LFNNQNFRVAAFIMMIYIIISIVNHIIILASIELCCLSSDLSFKFAYLAFFYLKSLFTLLNFLFNIILLRLFLIFMS